MAAYSPSPIDPSWNGQVRNIPDAKRRRLSQKIWCFLKQKRIWASRISKPIAMSLLLQVITVICILCHSCRRNWWRSRGHTFIETSWDITTQKSDRNLTDIVSHAYRGSRRARRSANPWFFRCQNEPTFLSLLFCSLLIIFLNRQCPTWFFLHTCMKVSFKRRKPLHSIGLSSDVFELLRQDQAFFGACEKTSASQEHYEKPCC